MRTIVDLSEEQIRQLAQACQREGLSRAEAIRRAVAAYLRERTPCVADETFGLWRDRAVDGLEYEERLRREWP